MDLVPGLEGAWSALADPPRRLRNSWRALVLADRSGTRLAPLHERGPVALLPIAGQPVIVHVIEDLARARISRVVVATSQGAEALRAVLGDGTRWGVAIESVLTDGEIDLQQAIAKLPAPHEPWLVVRGDQFLGPCVARFLDAVSEHPDACCVAVDRDGRTLGLAWIRGPRDAGDVLASPDQRPSRTVPQGFVRVPVEGVRFEALDSHASFHGLNLDAVRGNVPGVTFPGRFVALGVTAGRSVRDSRRAIRGGTNRIGSNSTVRPSAELLGDVVLCDETFVDRWATLQNAVVLPNTYIGESLEVRDAIVAGDLILRVDTGVVTRMPDAPRPAGLERRHPLVDLLSAALHRTLGSAALLLSVPLWPLALLATWVRSPGHPIEFVELLDDASRGRGSHRRARLAFRTWRFRCGPPVLRHLPLLLEVVRGRLRLVGITPLHADEDLGTDAWQRIRRDAPAGLLGLAQLTCPSTATSTERHRMDVVQARSPSVSRDVQCVLRGLVALFTPRAWRSRA